jgi:hypothetical protein
MHRLRGAQRPKGHLWAETSRVTLKTEWRRPLSRFVQLPYLFSNTAVYIRHLNTREHHLAAHITGYLFTQQVNRSFLLQNLNTEAFSFHTQIQRYVLYHDNLPCGYVMYPINSILRQCIPIRLKVASKVIMVLWGLPTHCSACMFQIPHAYTSYTCRSWLRHCATSRKVAGSIPDSVIGIFHWHNLSGRTMNLGWLSL